MRRAVRIPAVRRSRMRSILTAPSRRKAAGTKAMPTPCGATGNKSGSTLLGPEPIACNRRNGDVGVTMGKRETAYRAHKVALVAREKAKKFFGIGSEEYLAADAKLLEALDRLPAPSRAGVPGWK